MRYAVLPNVAHQTSAVATAVRHQDQHRKGGDPMRSGIKRRAHNSLGQHNPIRSVVYLTSDSFPEWLRCDYGELSDHEHVEQAMLPAVINYDTGVSRSSDPQHNLSELFCVFHSVVGCGGFGERENLVNDGTQSAVAVEFEHFSKLSDRSHR
jgi:hypothetical protein